MSDFFTYLSAAFQDKQKLQWHAKVQIKIGNKEELSKKNRRAIKKSPKLIWNFKEYFVSLHRQNVSFGYPGRIPRRQDSIDTALGARLHRPYSILKTIPLGWFLSFIDLYKHSKEVAV